MKKLKKKLVIILLFFSSALILNFYSCNPNIIEKYYSTTINKTIIEIFEQVLRHEEFVTSRINHLADVADEVKDRAALHLLD